MKPYVLAAVVLSFLAPEETNAAIPVHQVAPGIYRGPAPQTEADYQMLKELGVRTVLNLRKVHRREIAYEGRRLAALGISHRHVPTAYFPPSDDSVARALQVISDFSLHPIYVHCKHGKDRTGLIVGLFRVRHQGWSGNRAYVEMTRMRFNPRLAGLRNHFWRNSSPGIQIVHGTTPPGRSSAGQQLASSSSSPVIGPMAAMSVAPGQFTAVGKPPGEVTAIVSANKPPAVTKPVVISGNAATKSTEATAVATEPASSTATWFPRGIRP